MPTYEYACSACANEWELEQSIKEDPIKECPKCHGQTARRQISRGTGFILKGSGWYSDLYSSSSNKPAESKTTESKTTESKPETKTETKTEPKTETKTDTTPKTPTKGEAAAA